VKLFKTQFIKYNSKKDSMLEKEVIEMLHHLREKGSKNSAKSKTINKQLMTAV